MGCNWWIQELKPITFIFDSGYLFKFINYMESFGIWIYNLKKYTASVTNFKVLWGFFKTTIR